MEVIQGILDVFWASVLHKLGFGAKKNFPGKFFIGKVFFGDFWGKLPILGKLKSELYTLQRQTRAHFKAWEKRK